MVVNVYVIFGEYDFDDVDMDMCPIERTERDEINICTSKTEAIRIAQKALAKKYDRVYVYRRTITEKGRDEKAKRVYFKRY